MEYLFCLLLVAKSCPTLCDPMTVGYACQAPLWNSPGKNAGVGSHSLLQGIFPTQGSNSALLHYRQILYCLSHQERPTIEYYSALKRKEIVAHGTT